RLVEWHPLEAELAARRGVTGLTASDMAVHDRQFNPAELGVDRQRELKIGARKFTDRHRDDRIELAAELMLAELDNRTLARRVLRRISIFGQRLRGRPTIGQQFEQVAVERRHQRIPDLASDIAPGELHSADLLVLAQPFACAIAER